MFNKKEKFILIITSIFIIVSVWFMFGKEVFFPSPIRSDDSTLMPEANGVSETIGTGVRLEQNYQNSTDIISRIGIVFSRENYYDDATLVIELWNGNNLIASNSYNAANINSEHRTFLDVNTNGMKNKKLTIKIYSLNENDTGLRAMIQKRNDSTYIEGDYTTKGTICFQIEE